MSGEVVFVGAGPGSPDLITVRGATVIAEADIVIWASSLVDPGIVAGVKPGAEVVDSASLPLEGIEPLYRRARDEGLLVARVHTGDPSIYGATAEQRRLCDRIGIPHRTIPGVSAFSAAAARMDAEITVPEVSQTLILTRLEGGRTPMPARETVRGFAAHGATMAVYLSAARNKVLQTELLAGGYPAETPCIIGFRVTWPDELMLRCRLDELSATMAEHKLWKHTVVLVGPALGAQGETRSHLYHPGFRHEYRKAEGEAPVPAADTIHRAPRAAHRTATAVPAAPARASSSTSGAGELSGNCTSMPETPRNPAPTSIDLQNRDIDSATAPTTGPTDPAAPTAGSPTAGAGELSGNRTSMPETPRNPAPASIDLQNRDIDSATAPTADPAAAVVSAATPAGTTTEAGDTPTEQEQR